MRAAAPTGRLGGGDPVGNAGDGGAPAALHAVQVAFWVAVALVVTGFVTSRMMADAS
ncbi:hypothetical protein [Streptomyces lincolnensis]|uniref:hypothetical protein n=1 Tax=Streptomyces lincolnensis TaxID=1915 RepID=UPI0013521028|nr:hypothetical protein [Streptomyces lincolnensis]QMV11495.1 hypothetical protein GJU35_41305 [Streptomyces lincolnensis]